MRVWIKNLKFPKCGSEKRVKSDLTTKSFGIYAKRWMSLHGRSMLPTKVYQVKSNTAVLGKKLALDELK